MLKHIKCGLVLFATVGLVVPQESLAADQNVQVATGTPDIKLVGGVLTGRVISGNGQPVSTIVRVSQGDTEVARVQTGVDGIYKVGGLKSGQYVVSTDSGSATIRTWTNAAPPQAVDTLTIAEGPVVRGQLLTGLFGGFSTTTVIVTTVVVGTAVGVGVAVANDDDDAPVSP